MKIHQTLHGYAGGHRLLEASIELDPESRKEMAVLSDLSGTVIVRGFESYLTGYPLREADFYVLARTWYAPEMDRPGSVWTHSLLLRFADLARLDDPTILEDAFRRPTGTNWARDWYEHAITLEVGQPFFPRLQPGFSQGTGTLISEVIKGLYGTQDPVFIATEEPLSVEEIVLWIWAQQWPRLRRAFSFCTGALDVRSIRRKPMDLQVVPRRRANMDGIVIVHGQLGQRARPETWVEIARADLARPGVTSLRRFLRRFGADVQSERDAFRPLTEIFGLIRLRGNRFSDLVTATGKAFPEQHDAATLKEAVFQIGEEGTTDIQVVTELITNPHSSAFTDAQTNIVSRIERLLTKNDDELADMLIAVGTSKLSMLGHRVTPLILEGLGVDSFALILSQNPAWLPQMLSVKPYAVTQPGFWALPDEVRGRALQHLSQTWGRESSLWSPVVVAIARLDPYAINSALTYIGPIGVFALLDAIDSGALPCDAEPWSPALTSRQEMVISWISEREDALGSQVRRVATKVLDPFSPAVHKLGTRPWQSIAKDVVSLHAAPGGHWELAFVLVQALANTDSTAPALASLIFPQLYSLAAENRIELPAWELLRRIHLRHGTPPDWDRCEWLRRALVDAAAHNRWPPSVVADVLPAVHDRERAAQYAQSFSEGQVVARALLESLPKPEKPKSTPSSAKKPPSQSKKRSSKKPKRRGWLF